MAKSLIVDRLLVRDIMGKPKSVLTEDNSLSFALNFFIKDQEKYLVVLSSAGKPIFLLEHSDLIDLGYTEKSIENTDNISIGQVLKRIGSIEKVVCIHPNADIKLATLLMIKSSKPLIVAEKGKLVGLLAISEVLRYYTNNKDTRAAKEKRRSHRIVFDDRHDILFHSPSAVAYQSAKVIDISHDGISIQIALPAMIDQTLLLKFDNNDLLLPIEIIGHLQNLDLRPNGLLDLQLNFQEISPLMTPVFGHLLNALSENNSKRIKRKGKQDKDAIGEFENEGGKIASMV